MMRILKGSIYILAVLAICEFSQKAGAAPNFELAENKIELGNAAAANDSAILKLRRALHQKTAKAQDEDKSSNYASASYSQTDSKISPDFSKAASDLLVQATTPSDIEGHWAQSFIEALVGRGIIQGFPDGSFRPEEPVTRAQFAAIINKAFPQNGQQEAIAFVDVSPNYWAQEAIQAASQTGFLAGYPGNVFSPEQNIPRAQVLVSLSNGLKFSTTQTAATVLNTYFQDAADIPDYAQNSIAAATQKRIVVNYPNVALLNPNQIATRADVAAVIYQALVSTGAVPPLSRAIASQYIVGSQQTAATPPTEAAVEPPSAEEIQKLQTQLSKLERTNDFGNIYQGSPGISVAIPSGFGADQNTFYTSFGYQGSTWLGNEDDGSLGVGFGFGNSRKSIGVELSYTAASFGGSRDFGSGGFNIKLHRQLPKDFGVAVGYNGFLNIGGGNDFQDTIYGVVTKVLRTRPNVNSPLSRVAVSVGLGNGQFSSEGYYSDEGRENFNVFGGAAVRIARPVSFIAEWTGQDLGLGLSITPFKKSSFVITPALRDVVGGAEDGVRFTLGAGFSFRFK